MELEFQGLEWTDRNMKKQKGKKQSRKKRSTVGDELAKEVDQAAAKFMASVEAQRQYADNLSEIHSRLIHVHQSVEELRGAIGIFYEDYRTFSTEILAKVELRPQPTVRRFFRPDLIAKLLKMAKR